MNLRNLHKSQLKAAIYKLLSCPGVLTDGDILDVLTEITEEVEGGN